MALRPRGDVRSRATIALVTAVLAGCSAGDEQPVAGGTRHVDGPIDLVADTNRSGAIEFDDPTESDGEDDWNAAHGAVFLANIDDDLRACPPSTSDLDLPQCNDAMDEVVNGPDDLLDLAPLSVKAWPAAPDAAAGRIQIAEPGALHVRLFRRADLSVFDAANSTLDSSELRAGVDLLVEGKDIVRDASIWDGYLDVTLIVEGDGVELGRDALRMRMSPVMTHHHLAPAETIHATNFAGYQPSQQFLSALEQARVAAGTPNALHTIDVADQWTQDFFEPAYMSMPAPGGAEHVIRVYYRSANTRDPAPVLRKAGQVVFTVFRGPDGAGVQQYDPNRPAGESDRFDSLGNVETIPPYKLGANSYPLGRLFRGSVEGTDQTFRRMLEAQGVQPPIYIPTDWLEVGHVDETISVVKAPSERGWVMLVDEPNLARQMIEDQVAKGNGSVQMFVGLTSAGVSAAVSLSDVLNDPELMSASAEAAADIDAQLEVLKRETGITDAEIVKVPFLHRIVNGGSAAYQPGTVNGVYLSDGTFAVPEPHGPVIDGEDIFKAQLDSALGAVGVRVAYIEDWTLYHSLGGEVHCGSNSTRAIVGPSWWLSGY